ncbi:hypothetical protein MKX01_013918 [Papaver californicum]|nr:hypothetical protein MKX01_013918 [Papaver californicum]
MATSLAARLTRKTLTSAAIGPITQSIFGLTRPFSTAVATDSSSSSSKIPTTITRDNDEKLKWDYRGQRQVIPLGQWLPTIAVDAYVAPNVVLAGQVTVCDGSSVWSGSVLRGDLNKITVGFCSNVQERCVLHAAWSSPTDVITNLDIEFCLVGYMFMKSINSRLYWNIMLKLHGPWWPHFTSVGGFDNRVVKAKKFLH